MIVTVEPEAVAVPVPCVSWVSSTTEPNASSASSAVAVIVNVASLVVPVTETV